MHTTGMLLGKDDSNTPLRLDPKALTTHGFVLGMTGAGKTGMCVVMVEELLRAGVPVIAVDSKGDLATLLLNFDAGDADNISKWTNDVPGASKNISMGQNAAGLSPSQATEFRKSYETRLYTPGANIGLTLDLVGNLAPPASTDAESISDAADNSVRGLLSLLGISADPVSSREYLFLSQVLTTMWTQGLTPTLADLVRSVINPGFDTLGALDLDEFYPPKARRSLLNLLNGLLASPRFAAWRTGESLDPGTMFRGPSGKPRLSIYSVAHLSEDERIFAVAQLLERAEKWMRKEGSSGALRGVIFIDEIFGYFPPTANPPTKAPLLALLKQARAFGLSILLATQNPVDLDYRGLANIGTWLIGRLQTEQDKNRIRDTLLASAAASTGITGEQLDALISKLAPRKFLLHSIHREKPTVVSSRQCMTMLHGPFSSNQLKELSAGMRPVVEKPSASQALVAAWLPVYESTLGSLVLVPHLLVDYTLEGEKSDLVAFSMENTKTPELVLENQCFRYPNRQFVEVQPTKATLAELPKWITCVSPKYFASTVVEKLAGLLEAAPEEVDIKSVRLAWMRA